MDINTHYKIMDMDWIKSKHRRYDFKLKFIALQISYYKYRSMITWTGIAITTVILVFLFVISSIMLFVINFLILHLHKPLFVTLCNCLWKNPSFEDYIFADICNSDNTEDAMEMCWRQKLKGSSGLRYLLENNSWIDVYFALAAVQCLLLYSQSMFEPLIQSINNYDKQRKCQLIQNYQITLKKLFNYKYEQYKKYLSVLSKNVLPSDLNQLALEFVTKSKENKITEIDEINEKSIGNQYWYRYFQYFALFILAIQLSIVAFGILVGLRTLQRFIRLYFSDFTFFVVLGIADRFSYLMMLGRV